VARWIQFFLPVSPLINLLDVHFRRNPFKIAVGEMICQKGTALTKNLVKLKLGKKIKRLTNKMKY